MLWRDENNGKIGKLVCIDNSNTDFDLHRTEHLLFVLSGLDLTHPTAGQNLRLSLATTEEELIEDLTSRFFGRYSGQPLGDSITRY